MLLLVGDMLGVKVGQRVHQLPHDFTHGLLSQRVAMILRVDQALKQFSSLASPKERQYINAVKYHKPVRACSPATLGTAIVLAV